MIGFTTEPNNFLSVSPEATFALVAGMAEKLQWDGVTATVQREKQSLGLGFGQSDIALLSFHISGDDSAFQQRNEANIFANVLNIFIGRIRGYSQDIQPSFNQFIAFATPTGEAAINLDLLRDALNKNPQMQHELGEVVKGYVRGRQLYYSEKSPDVEMMPQPYERSEVKPFLNEMAANLQWNGVSATIDYQKVPAIIGFGEREVARLSFVGADGISMPESDAKDEALNFQDVLQQFVNKSALNAGVPLNESATRVTGDGKVEIDLEMLHSIARKNPDFLKTLLNECHIYTDKQNPAFGETVNLRSGFQPAEKEQMSPQEMQDWQRSMAQVFRTPQGLENLFARAGDAEKMKLGQFCTKLSSYVFMMNIEPEKYAEVKKQDPTFAEAVEAYADYLMHKQMERSGVGREDAGTEYSEPQPAVKPTFAERESKRSPDNRFPQRG